jgi:4-carboxymuconolactone decarboxylase
MAETVDLAAERKARIDKALAALRELDPSWADMFNTYVLSGMYERNVIDQKTRELCAVAALTVLDRSGPLKDHIKGAFRQGASNQEVLEVIFQSSVYGGFPTTLSALNHYRDVVKEIAANG